MKPPEIISRRFLYFETEIVIKKLLFLILLCTQIILPQVHQIKSFDELIQTLKCGNDARVVVHYKNCKLFIDNVEVNSVNAVGGMEISTFEYFAKGSIKNEKAYIVFSENVLISHKKYGYVFNYVKIRIFEDNQVEITAQYLKTYTYEVVMDEVFYCEINLGENEGGVFLFSD